MAAGRVLVACDKFKGSLDVREVTRIIEDVIARSTRREVKSFLVADGGDGTLDALRAAGFADHPVTVSGPTGEAGQTAFLERAGVVVVEMADACGLLRLPGSILAPIRATSVGLGQVLRRALATRPHEVIMGVGGSASTDGGAGLLVGLGARLWDAAGKPVEPTADRLSDVAEIDLSGLPGELADTRLVLASDVDNPLLGPRGAAAVFGPQKGLVGEAAKQVEEGLSHWADLLARTTGKDLRESPGAGAAGGVGFAALAVLGATMRPGIGIVLELSGFAEALDDAALVITGEGSLDHQTLMGKTVAGVAAAAYRARVPVVAICGRSTLSARELASIHVERVYALSDIEPDPANSMKKAAALLARRVDTVVEEWL
jgi:glycerate kinase